MGRGRLCGLVRVCSVVFPRWFLLRGPFASILEPVALSAGLQNVAAMGKPIEDGAGQSFVIEDFSPLFERQVRGVEQDKFSS